MGEKEEANQMKLDSASAEFRMYPGKALHSRDPRKKQVLRALKHLTGCSRVTFLYELKDGSFQAHCLKGNGKKYESLGYHRISKQEVEALGK